MFVSSRRALAKWDRVGERLLVSEGAPCRGCCGAGCCGTGCHGAQPQPEAGGGSVPLSWGVLSTSPEQGWFRRSSGLQVSGGPRGMQVETLASVVVVVGFFSQYSWVLGLVSLSLPPSDFFLFASPCLHLHVTRFLGKWARVAPLHPIASGQRGA